MVSQMAVVGRETMLQYGTAKVGNVDSKAGRVVGSAIKVEIVLDGVQWAYASP